jgi:H+-transporting ATPase
MNQTKISTDEAKKTSVDELMNKLSSSKGGISEQEAKNRLQQYGPNEITKKRESKLTKFLKYFWGPIPWMIEVAVILSAIINHWEDFAIILELVWKFEIL